MALAHISVAVPFYAVPALSIQIQDALAIDHTHFGWLVSAWAAGGFVVSVAAGPINRILPARTLVLIANLASLVLLGIALGRATTLEAGLLVLVLAGVAYSVVTPATSSALAITISQLSWATGMGVKQTGVPLGGALGAVAAAILEPAVGWQNTLLLVSLAAFALGSIAWLAFPASALQIGDRFEQPIVRSSRKAVSAYGLCLVLAGSSAAVTTYLAIYFGRELGMMPSVAAALLGSALFGGAIGRIGWGVLGDALGPSRRGLALLGPLALGGLGLFALGGVTADGETILLISLVVGVATVGWAGVQSALVVDLAGRQSAASATGINAAVAYVGVFAGPILFAALAEQLASLRAAWTLVGFVLLLSTPLVLLSARTAPSGIAAPETRL